MAERRFLFAGASGIWTTAVLAPFAGRDFDPVHDGAMLAPAIVARDGGLPHVAVESFYGPLIPILQGFALSFGDAPVLALRVLNVILCAAVSAAMMFVGDDELPGWPVPVHAAIGAGVLWPVMSDVLRGAPMHPWPSVPAALCVVLAIVALRYALRASRVERRTRASLLAASAGLLLALMFLFRLAPGLAVVMAVPVLYLLVRRTAPELGVVLRWVATGSLTGLTLAAGALASVGALDGFVEQAILAPFGYFVVGTATEGSGGVLYWIKWAFPVARGIVALVTAFLLLRWAVVASGAIRRGALVVAAMAVVLTGVVLRLVPVGLISSRIESGQFRVGAPGAAVILTGIAATCVIVAVLVPLLARVEEIVENGRLAPPLILPAALFAGALLPPVETIVVAVIGASAALAYSARRAGSSRNSVSGRLLALPVAGIALGALVEGVSVPDTRHFWWGAPVGLILLLGLASKRGQLRPVVVGLAVSVGLGVLSGLPGTLEQRVPYSDDTVAAGMVGRPESVRSIDATTRLLREQTSNGGVLFLASEGDLAVALGTYRSMDRYFLYSPDGLSAAQSDPNRFGEANWIVVNPPSCQACRRAVPLEFVPVAETDRIVLFERLSREP